MNLSKSSKNLSFDQLFINLDHDAERRSAYNLSLCSLKDCSEEFAKNQTTIRFRRWRNLKIWRIQRRFIKLTQNRDDFKNNYR